MASNNRNFRWRGRRNWAARGGGRYRKSKQKPVTNNFEDEEAGASLSGHSRSESPTTVGPYKGWNLYFSEAYNDQHPAIAMIQLFEEYFKTHMQFYNLEDIENRGSFCVDLEKLKAHCGILDAIPNLELELITEPEPFLRNLGLAMHQLIVAEQEKEDDSGDDEDDGFCLLVSRDEHTEKLRELKRVQARIINVNCRIPLCELKAIYIGKLVNIHGTVIRVGEVKPLVTKMPFKCATCGKIQLSHFPDGKYTIPKTCTSRGCRGRTFIPENIHESIKSVDWQTIRVQEINDDDCDVGRIPRTVECEVSNDLVDSCVPGDVVTITGIVKVSNNGENAARNCQDKCLFLLYIEVNSICNSKGNVGQLTATTSSREVKNVNSIGMEFSMKEFYAIREIQEQDNLFRLIVHSLCPAIYGHEMVKAGLVLALFGGTQRFVKDEYRMPNRANSHVLVVGDPGLGKSQMLKACANVSPRGVYVSGSTATTAGLTVTLTKDNNGESSLEAGALVFADMGCCCVDEFDKMGQQRHALLEAMEQQTISIAKAGVTCTLPSRASVLAAANPAEGHYNKAKTISENLKISRALLSRFDLVFILLDKPDEAKDNMLTEHLMALHAGGAPSKVPTKITIPPSAEMEGDSSLRERLNLKCGEILDHIPHQLLKKYIGYARQYVQVNLSPPSANVLQRFYLELRKNHQNSDSVPITTRQLESLIRLTEARAKLELREEATKDDAKDVVEIMRHSMMDIYSDEHGSLDFTRSQNGSGMSGRSVAKRLITILTNEAKRTNNSMFSVQRIRDLVKESGIQCADLNSVLDSLNNHSYLLQKGPRIYQLQNV